MTFWVGVAKKNWLLAYHGCLNTPESSENDASLSPMNNKVTKSCDLNRGPLDNGVPKGKIPLTKVVVQTRSGQDFCWTRGFTQKLLIFHPNIPPPPRVLKSQPHVKVGVFKDRAGGSQNGTLTPYSSWFSSTLGGRHNTWVKLRGNHKKNIWLPPNTTLDGCHVRKNGCLCIPFRQAQTCW